MRPSDLSVLSEFCEKFSLSLSESQTEKLCLFYTLVTEAGKSFNLTSITDGFSFMSRHFADSLSATLLFDDGAEVCDVGTGAGFPAVPLAIARPDVSFTALDSTQKKTAFVADAAKLLGLSNLTVKTGRAEDFSSVYDNFDFVCSRAVTALSPLVEICFPLLKTGGCLIAYKTPAEKLSDCENALSFLHGRPEKELPYTLPDGSSRVLYVLKKLSPTPKGYPRKWAQIKNKPL